VKYEKRRELPTWRWWHWRFALLPTWFGDNTRLWLEFYQCRMKGLCGERRDSRGHVEAFCIHP
jgi:hypothetical protein